MPKRRRALPTRASGICSWSAHQAWTRRRSGTTQPVAVMYKHVHEPIIPPCSIRPSVPVGLSRVIETMMAKDPSERYAAPRDLVAALESPMPDASATHPARQDAAAMSFEAAMDAYRGRDHAKAIAEFKAYIKQHPGRTADYYLGIEFIMGKHGFDRAMSELLATVRAQPDHPDVRTKLAFLFIIKSMLRQGVDKYKKALAAQPDDPVLHLKLGRLLNTLREPPAAADQFHAALQLDGANREALNELIQVELSVGRLDEAMRLCKRALAADATNHQAHLALGDAFKRKGDQEQAERCYLEALRYRPDAYQAHNSLASLCISSGQRQRAVQHRQTSLGIQSNQPQVRALLQEFVHK